MLHAVGSPSCGLSIQFRRLVLRALSAPYACLDIFCSVIFLRLAMLCCAGPVHAVILALFQYLNLVLSSIGYTVAAGQSLR